MRSKKYIENLFKNGKCFCVLPWIHLHVTGHGYMSPCCLHGPDSKGYGSLNDNTLSELWQGEAIRNFRLKMLADEMDERCVNCYENEKTPKFIEITNQLDHLRNEKCTEVFPELEPIFSGDPH